MSQQLISFVPDVDPDILMAAQRQQQSGASSPIELQQPPTSRLGRLGRRRARDGEGQFKADDPATAENEAFESSTTADSGREN
jgi:hypothetical protein